MLKIVCAVFTGFIFVQVHGTVEPNQKEALNILLKIYVDVNLRGDDYKDKIPEWNQQYADAVKEMNSTIIDVNKQTELQIHHLMEEANEKGEAGLQCIKNAYDSLTSMFAQTLNTFTPCTINTNVILTRNMGEIYDRVFGTVPQTGKWLDRYLSCGSDETCFENIIPALNGGLTELLGIIDGYIKYMDEYVLDMCDNRLNYCDNSETFNVQCQAVLTVLRICIDNA